MVEFEVCCEVILLLLVVVVVPMPGVLLDVEMLGGDIMDAVVSDVVLLVAVDVSRGVLVLDPVCDAVCAPCVEDDEEDCCPCLKRLKGEVPAPGRPILSEGNISL